MSGSQQPDDKFINPYTFVPFPEVDEATFKAPPAGHDRLGEADGLPRYLGQVELVVTARSPVLVRDGNDHFPRRRVAGYDEPVAYLPGSGVAGVFRSLHESIAGGCLRVFDEGFLPTYRDEVRPNLRSWPWRLALVDDVDEDYCPRKLRLCSRYDRVAADVLAKVLGGPEYVVTGARVSVREPRDGKARPQRIVDDRSVAAGDDSVVLVTDSQTRMGKPKYFCTVGTFSKGAADEVLTWSTQQEFRDGWQAAWDDFVRRVNDTDDMRHARGTKQAEQLHRESAPVLAPVHFPPEGDRKTLVGMRHEARPWLYRGQVLWVKPNQRGDGADEFALSTVWRHTGGTHPAGERVPKPLRPCTDPEQLCPTCRVWGSANEAGKDEDGKNQQARQDGYRGHVRISDAYPLDGPPKVQPHHLPPLGQPRAGAGQFYLQPTTLRPVKGEAPLREWGSPADAKELRQLRGRKQYWLSENWQQRPLFRVTTGEFTGDMASTAESVPAGTQFAVTVRFENLSLAELGGLLAALAPQMVLDEYRPGEAGGPVGFAVGGGRPLGFGACTSEITSVTAHTAASWYGFQTAPEVTVREAVEAFCDQVDGGVRDRWDAVASALTIDRVPADVVWYPPAAAVGRGELSADDLQTSFAFWKESQTCPPHLALPEVTQADQTLPVIRDKSTNDNDQRPTRGHQRGGDRSPRSKNRGTGRGRR